MGNHQQTAQGRGHPFIHRFAQHVLTGTCYVSGPVHSLHRDLLSAGYVAGGVTRTGLISALPELGGPGTPTGGWSGYTRTWRAIQLVGSGSLAPLQLCQAC